MLRNIQAEKQSQHSGNYFPTERSSLLHEIDNCVTEKHVTMPEIADRDAGGDDRFQASGMADGLGLRLRLRLRLAESVRALNTARLLG